LGEVLSFPKKQRQRAPAQRMALTEKRIEEFTEPGVISDTKTKGLAVRVSKGGAKTYVYRRKIMGKVVFHRIDSVDGIRLDAARKVVDEMNGKAARGVDLRAERAQKRVLAKALAHAFEEFKQAKARRPSTEVDHEFLWRNHVPTYLKSKPITDITSDDIEKAKRSVIAKGRARTAAKTVALLSAVLNSAGRWADNPARGVERPASVTRTRRLTIKEVGAVLDALDKRQNDLWADFLAVALWTGARRGALQTMRWDDLHLEDSVWMVPAVWSKNGRELAIGLSLKVVHILKCRREKRGGGPWVWPSGKSETGHVVSPEKPLKKLLGELGIDRKLSMHDLRRTLGSRLAMTGANAATISKTLGHLSPQSAKSYVHMDVEASRAAIERALNRRE
jgi:integrase